VPVSTPNDLLGVRVLIVEDDPDNAEMLSEFLRHHGIDSRMTNMAQAVVEIVKSFRPHVVLLDIDLSGHYDGHWVLRRIRELETRLADVLVVATTGERNATEEAGRFSGVLTKPLDLDRLIGLLRIHAPHLKRKRTTLAPALDPTWE
jgi:DNA-binding response OmpR family regulator